MHGNTCGWECRCNAKNSIQNLSSQNIKYNKTVDKREVKVLSANRREQTYDAGSKQILNQNQHVSSNRFIEKHGTNISFDHIMIDSGYNSSFFDLSDISTAMKI